MKVYLDYHSTTPVDVRVLDEMFPFFREHFANPSSQHMDGEDAAEAVELARERVAASINADPTQIYFTTSATEANNIVLKGLWLTRVKNEDRAYSGMSFISNGAEHSSVLKCMKSLCGGRVNHHVRAGLHLINVNKDGSLDLGEFEQLISRGFTYPVVSMMAANNEVGTIHDIKRIGDICKRYGAYYHCDAVQALGKVPIDVQVMNIDALTLSSHKIYGPKGVGALYVKDDTDITPLIDGGYQSILTSGTLNVPAIVGFGMACELLNADPNENVRIGMLRDLLLQLLQSSIKDLQINGSMDNRLPNNLNISIDGIPSEAIIKGMEDVMVSGGSACRAIGNEASHVLMAMKVDSPSCAIRFGLGRWTTREDIEYAASKIIEIVQGVRNAENG
jgi:cysteine desulfurase